MRSSAYAIETRPDTRPLKKDGDEDYKIHRIILGTHTSNQATDQLMIAEVLLPKINAESASKEVTKVYDEEQQGKLLKLMSLT